jgi:hypothetical protein
MSESPQKINISEFRTDGYLQELNRTFLHPLGLALVVAIDDNGNEQLDGILDYRDDPEGMIYGLKDSDNTRINKFIKNKLTVDLQRNKIAKTRITKCGFDIEPISLSDSNG